MIIIYDKISNNVYTKYSVVGIVYVILACNFLFFAIVINLIICMQLNY